MPQRIPLVTHLFSYFNDTAHPWLDRLYNNTAQFFERVGTRELVNDGARFALCLIPFDLHVMPPPAYCSVVVAADSAGQDYLVAPAAVVALHSESAQSHLQPSDQVVADLRV